MELERSVDKLAEIDTIATRLVYENRWMECVRTQFVAKTDPRASMGSWEQAPDADPLDVARGELREETGLDAAQMTHAGHLFQAYGYYSKRMAT